jgi:hypothetical protein
MWWPRLARERASAAPMLLAEQPVMRMVLGIARLEFLLQFGIEIWIGIDNGIVSTMGTSGLCELPNETEQGSIIIHYYCATVG